MKIVSSIVFHTLLLAITIHCSYAQQKIPNNTSNEFRGGFERNGCYKGVDFNLLKEKKWQVKLGSSIRSSPIFSNDHIYVGCSDSVLYCINASNGAIVWRFKAKSAVHSTPSLQDGKIFFTDKKNNLYALSQANGKEIWQKNLGADLPYPWGFDYYQSSPTVHHNQVFVGSGNGSAYALNAVTGAIIWSYQTPSLIRSSPTFYNNTVYFGDLSGKVHAVNAKTGQPKWIFATVGDTINNELEGNDFKAVIASVAIKDTIAIIGGRDGNLYALHTITGKELWRYSYDGSWVISSAAISDKTVVSATSDGRIVNALDLITGKELWKYKVPASVWASPVVVNSTVAAACNDGFMYILDLHTGKEKSRQRIGDRFLSTPAYSDGVLFTGTDDGYMKAYPTATKSEPVNPVKKAVFWTSDVMGKHFKPGIGVVIRDYFIAEGYELLNEEKLVDFLQKNSSDKINSVVVFAVGYFPEKIITGTYRNNILYHYLNNGGKTVVVGLNPSVNRFDFKTGAYKGIDYTLSDSIIGVKYPFPDLRTHYGFYPSGVTLTGLKWGLKNTVPAYAALSPDSVTALSIDENGKAPYWVKNYGFREGTGFVQLWIQASILNNLEEFKKIAEFGVQ